MKKGEVAMFEIEEVIRDKVTLDRKLDNNLFFIVELIDWITIIDVYGD